MKKCGFCGTEFEDSLKRCPKCNVRYFEPHEQMTPKKFFKIFLITAAIMVAFWVVMMLALGGFHEHDMQTVIKDATCTEDGTETHRCMDCDYVSYERTIYKGHKMAKERVVTAPTCTSDGSAIYKCKVCGTTEEWTESSLHKTLSGECSICGAKTSDITADTWYTLSNNKVVYCQNAEVSTSSPVSGGKAFMVTYYPVCKDCGVCGKMQMEGVSTDSPVTRVYNCRSCKTATYVRFKVEY